MLFPVDLKVFVSITVYILPPFLVQNHILLCKFSQAEWLTEYCFASVMLLLLFSAK